MANTKKTATIKCKRCRSGTRKRCVRYTKLSEADIQAFINQYGLKPRASRWIKQIRLNTHFQNEFRTYDPAQSDGENLYWQVNAKIVDVLRHGTPAEQKKIR
jgi:hypothetical protein